MCFELVALMFCCGWFGSCGLRVGFFWFCGLTVVVVVWIGWFWYLTWLVALCLLWGLFVDWFGRLFVLFCYDFGAFIFIVWVVYWSCCLLVCVWHGVLG